MRVWTEQQEDAISARRGTVLVSAAAGSGKTSVLVERVIQRLTNGENPTPADKLLIVTFTNAAAAEMKERVEAAILRRLQEEPENKALRRQQMLCSQMNISTVHSFCSKLVREFFYVLDIAPDYKIVTDKQREDLMAEALNEVIDEAFQEGMYELADAFSSERDDRRLFEVILKLYEFMNSHLFPGQWLRSKLALYSDDAELEKSPWAQVLLTHLGEVLSFCRQLTEDSIRALREDQRLEELYGPTLLEDLGLIDRLLDTAQEKDWDEISAGLQRAAFGRMPQARGYAGDSLKERVAAARKNVKDYVGDMAALFCDTAREAKEDLLRTGPLVSRLAEIIEAFTARFTAKKREKKLADYGDLEHWTIALLLEEQEGRVVPSAIARDLSHRFDEIMVDEYQDTNEVQDWIFRALSKENGNKFMVGDLKQCVYSFRQAMPDIFIRYKEEFRRYDRREDQYPATIILDKNYRSRDTVIHSVNYVFSQLMSKQAGGIDYVGDEALSLGASYEPGPGYETQLDFLEKKKGVPQEISEARHIAKTIRELVESGLPVNDGGIRRPVTYRDFCILLRSANKFAYAYARELQSLAVPAWAAVSDGFFAATEIAQAIAFLQVIDNPNQDIPLLSLLMGPVYGFTPDDLAELRLHNRKISIYVSLLEDKSSKFQGLLEDLEGYRLLAAVMPSDAFIDHLFTSTGYEDLVLSMENGESRLMNLRKLQQYAKDYESAGYIGISGFVRFVEKLRQSKSDLESANLISENANVVRIMSIHKSKGLEFPVCFVAGCGRKKYLEHSDVALNSRLGLGLKLKDESTGARYSNIIRDAVMLENRGEAMSEELRVLYVAMTRAREKLIMVSTMENLDSTLARLSAQLTEGPRIAPFTVKSLSSMGEWLLLCALKHPDGAYLRDRIGAEDSIVSRAHFTPWVISALAAEEAPAPEPAPEQAEIRPDPALMEQIRQKIEFRYPHEGLNGIPAKVTASALSEKEAGREQSLSRPAFLSAKGLTPAERGIALHSFMQFCEFKKAAVNPESECSRLVQSGFITAEEGAAVNLQKVRAFFESPLGKRMTHADRVLKEQRFTANIPANLVNPEFPAEVPVILQGAVDCAFYENGRLFIVDFKTDRIDSEEQLKAAYGMQLSLYAKALTQVREVPVGGCYLYSLHMNREIQVE